MNSCQLQQCLKSRAIGFPCWLHKYIRFQISFHVAVNQDIPTSNHHRFMRIHWIYLILFVIFIKLFIFFSILHCINKLTRFASCHKIKVVHCKEIKLCQVLLNTHHSITAGTKHRSQVIVLPIQKVSQTLVKANRLAFTSVWDIFCIGKTMTCDLCFVPADSIN